MNQVATIEQAPKQSLIEKMASKASMSPKNFEITIRSTVMPEKHTDAQFASLMLIAHEYGLNPILKELYAFPAKGGGIVPIVSIDGWVNLINSHQQANGFTFEFDHDENGELVSCTCKMFRKDRDHPVEVTEYLSECRRNTDPWKMKHRMLRHKSLIQAARYAFGFSGIYDEDEARVIAGAQQAKPADPELSPPSPSQFVDNAPSIDSEPEHQDIQDAEVLDSSDEKPQSKPDQEMSEATKYDDVLSEFSNALGKCKSADDVQEVWNEYEHLQETLSDDDAEALRTLYSDRLVAVAGEGEFASA